MIYKNDGNTNLKKSMKTRMRRSNKMATTSGNDDMVGNNKE